MLFIFLLALLDIFLLIKLCLLTTFSLVGYLLIIAHLLTAIAMAYCFMVKLKKNYPKQNRAFLALLASYNFFVPGISIIGNCAIVFMLIKLQGRLARSVIQYLDVEPEIHLSATQYGVGGAAARLRTTQLPTNQRIAALLKISANNAKQNNVIITSLLTDSNEELRLLAFGLLEQQQKIISSEISKTFQFLKDASEPQEQAKAKKCLAFLYWELLYKKLIEPSLYEYCSQKVLEYANEALAVLNSDAMLWVLLGKIYNRSGQIADAKAALKRAHAMGAPASQIKPYLAEHFYLEHNYQAVFQLFASEPALANVPTVGAIAQFWNSSNE